MPILNQLPCKLLPYFIVDFTIENKKMNEMEIDSLAKTLQALHVNRRFKISCMSTIQVKEAPRGEGEFVPVMKPNT
jgi:hypothetical protein